MAWISVVVPAPNPEVRRVFPAAELPPAGTPARHLPSERDGMIHREVQQSIPPRVEYTRTALGAQVAEHLEALIVTLETNIDIIQQAQAAYHRDQVLCPSESGVASLRGPAPQLVLKAVVRVGRWTSYPAGGSTSPREQRQRREGEILPQQPRCLLRVGGDRRRCVEDLGEAVIGVVRRPARVAVRGE